MWGNHDLAQLEISKEQHTWVFTHSQWLSLIFRHISILAMRMGTTLSFWWLRSWTLSIIVEILAWLQKFSKGKTLLMIFNRPAWFMRSILWYQSFPCMKYTSEYPALPYEVKRLETFSIIIRSKQTLAVEDCHASGSSLTHCDCLNALVFYCNVWLLIFRKQLIQEFRSQSKMTMLKSRISHAIQNCACQIVGWSQRQQTQCCSAVVYSK